MVTESDHCQHSKGREILLLWLVDYLSIPWYYKNAEPAVSMKHNSDKNVRRMQFLKVRRSLQI
jgi:hypothetical protein